MLLKIIFISTNFSEGLESHQLEIQKIIVILRVEHTEIEKVLRERKSLMEEALGLKNYYNVPRLEDKIRSKMVPHLKCLAYTFRFNQTYSQINKYIDFIERLYCKYYSQGIVVF